MKRLMYVLFFVLLTSGMAYASRRSTCFISSVMEWV